MLGRPLILKTPLNHLLTLLEDLPLSTILQTAADMTQNASSFQISIYIQ
jgi:hypothetical protein